MPIVTRLIVGLSLALMLGLSPPSAGEARAEDVTPSAGVIRGVLVRAEPMGAPARRVGALLPGQRAELLESVPHYYRVRLADGQVGYVSKRWTDVAAGGAAFLASGELVLHFIDVGQGDSTLIECPNGSTILIDSGSTSGRDPDEIQAYVVEVLDRHGGDLDTLIVSHPDEDHYNLLPDVLTDVRIRRAWYVGVEEDYESKAFKWLQSQTDARVVLGPGDFDPIATPNTSIACGEAKVWILAAAVEASASAKNAKSIVVMVRYRDFEAIITGDATRHTEKVVLGRFPADWLQVDLLRVGHHGSESTSTTAAWANTLRPSVAVVSAGYKNTYGHPRQEVIDRLAPHTAAAPPHGFRSAVLNDQPGETYIYTDTLAFAERIWTTAMSGTIKVRTRGAEYTVEAQR